SRLRRPARWHHRYSRHRSLSLGVPARRALRPGRGLRHADLRHSSALAGVRHAPPPAGEKSMKRALIRIAVHAFLVALTAVVLYPAALVVKKSIEPGNYFALSPSPIPHAFSAEHYRNILSGDNGLAFLHNGLSSAIVALATTLVGLALATT